MSQTGSREKPNVLTIAPGAGFLSTLAAAVIEGRLPDPDGRPTRPQDLPSVTIYLPTRRSVKAMHEALLDAAPRKALLLPKVLALGADEEELTILGSILAPAHLGDLAAAIQAAIGGLERRLLLSELVLAWSRAVGRTAFTAAQACGLAAELARLMDLVETEKCALTGLETLVPEGLAEHWRQTTDFLAILTQHWPQVLAERKLTSPGDRRNRLIEADARRLAALPPAGPVIVAGVTGSVPATQALIATVARLPQGAVVLPGLDLAMSDEDWQALAGHAGASGHPEHPQFSLARLLGRIGAERADVRVLEATGKAAPPASATARAWLVGEALRPAATTDAWHRSTSDPAARERSRRALAGLSRIVAPTAQDEADAIALVLRGALEQPGATAALVTPDRMLGRRVAVRLEEWGIRVDDSAGRPLIKTPPGALLDQIVEVLRARFHPKTLIALLKHPLVRLGLAQVEIRRAARALELIAFRGPYLGEGLAGVQAAVTQATATDGERPRQHPAARRLREADRAAALDLVERVATAFAPLCEIVDAPETSSLKALARAHALVADALARPAGEEEATLWSGDAGEEAARFLALLTDPAGPDLSHGAEDYADVLRSLMQGVNVRPSVALHPRLFIWGPLEARLMRPDLVVIGSLNEGVWPEAADPGPWLSRAMRAQLGLPAPEERIGYLAHDLAQLACAPRVVLTRAAKADGAPTTPSRWLMRLEAFLAGMDLAHELEPEEPWLAWARSRYETERPQPALQPEPRPPLVARPRRLSVSDVETWIANPYAIYARHVLRLESMPGLATEPGPDLRGSLIHQALHRFTRDHPRALPADPAAELMHLLDSILAERGAHPRIAAFWRPRFARFAEWLAATEPDRRAAIVDSMSEIAGGLAISAPAGRFDLTARADRIDRGTQGLVITDYKTGTLPRPKEVSAQTAPQLLLEAAIAQAGGFGERAHGPVTALRYIRASGGEPPGEERLITAGIDELAATAVAGLERLVATYDQPETPYRPARRAGFDYRFDDYAHLARVQEWAAVGGDDERE